MHFFNEEREKKFYFISTFATLFLLALIITVCLYLTSIYVALVLG